MTTEHRAAQARTGRRLPNVPGYALVEEPTSHASQKLCQARSLQTGNLVDMSFFLPPSTLDAAGWTKSIEQFSGLLEAQQKLAVNPSIQRILDYGQIENVFYVAAEHIDGRSLHEMLAAAGPRPLEWILPIFTEIAFALDFAAAHKLAHGGLTPHNIVINETDNTVHILDFGLARVRKRIGSPYLAPEQLAGQGGDTRSDMYSLGAILYECLSGRPPFVDDKGDDKRDVNAEDRVEAICQKIQTAEPPPLLQQPIYVREIIARMMMKSPSQRYRVFVDVVQDLQHQRRPAPLSGPQMPGAQAVDWVLGPQTPYFDALAGEVLPAEESPPAYSDLPVVGKGWLSRKTYALSQFLLAPFFALTALFPPRQKPAPSHLKVIRFRNEYLLVRWGRKGLYSLWRFGRIAVPMMLFMLSLHAGWMSGQEHYAVVKKVTGKATVRMGKVAVPLHIGDRLDALKLPLVTTGANSTVELEMPGSRVEIDSKSQVDVRLGFNHGEIQELNLHEGQIKWRLDAAPGPEDRFEITSTEVQARELGTECRAAVIRGGLKLTALAGDMRVYNGKIKQTLPSERKLNVLAMRPSPAPQPLTTQDKEPGAYDLAAKMESAWIPDLLTSYRQLQKQTLLPLANRALTLAHFDKQQQQIQDDAKVLITARYSLDGICKAILLNGEPLEELTLSSLEETGLEPKARKNLLSSFEKHRLLDYYAHKDHYTLFARADDSNHTLLKAEDGNISVVKDADEARELASLDRAKEAANQ